MDQEVNSHVGKFELNTHPQIVRLLMMKYGGTTALPGWE